MVGGNSIPPQQVLKEFLGFDVVKDGVYFNRPSIVLESTPTEEIKYIVPLMKFVAREVSIKAIFQVLDEYLDWKSNPVGEAEKNIKFVTVVGTSGKGKTTFARRFIDGEYTGKYLKIVQDCKKFNRRYRVTSVEFDTTRDPETQLSLFILREAFKHSLTNGRTTGSFIANFFNKYPHSTCRLILL